MDNPVVFKVGDLVRFRTKKDSRQWPHFTFNEVYTVSDYANDCPKIWDDIHNHEWYIDDELIELVTPESTIDIWATP